MALLVKACARPDCRRVMGATFGLMPDQPGHSPRSLPTCSGPCNGGREVGRQPPRQPPCQLPRRRTPTAAETSARITNPHFRTSLHPSYSRIPRLCPRFGKTVTGWRVAEGDAPPGKLQTGECRRERQVPTWGKIRSERTGSLAGFTPGGSPHFSKVHPCIVSDEGITRRTSTATIPAWLYDAATKKKHPPPPQYWEGGTAGPQGQQGPLPPPTTNAGRPPGRPWPCGPSHPAPRRR